MRREMLLALSVIFVLLAALTATSLLVSLAPVGPPAGQFDAGRAKARLATILGDQRPHPADSPADDAVRLRLVETLDQMGLRPVVRDQLACNNFAKARLIGCARVRNVIAALGPPRGKALLLSAHYDSVPVGPGASDDGIGVATLLEVASVLKAHPLRRPVLLLFDEGEELGLIGARAFLDDPLSRHVDTLLNFEARGVNGPAIMFETNTPNGPAVSAFARSVAHPVASSLSTDVARLIPNDTDVSTFKERGWTTLNTAIVGNETRYHSPGDDLAGLDTRSLQDMGEEALALATGLAAGAPRGTGSRAFFDVLRMTFVELPMPFACAWLLLLLGALAWVGTRRGGLVVGSAWASGALVGSGLLAWVFVTLMGAIRSGTYWRAHAELSFLAVFATILVAQLAAFCVAAKKLDTRRIRLGYWFAFTLLGTGLALAAPGATIYFLAPPSAVLIGILLSGRYPRAELIGALTGVLILYLTWAELLWTMETIFTPGPLWVVAPVAAIMIAPALIEATGLLLRAGARLVISSGAAIAVLSWCIVAAAPAYSEDYQQRFTIEHVTEFPSRRSSWSVLNDGAPLPAAYLRLSAWHRRAFDFSQRERWIAPAPQVAGIRAAAVELLANDVNGSSRTVTLRLRMNGAERMLIVAPAEAGITAAGLPGSVRPMGAIDSLVRFSLSCTGRSCDGREFVISLRHASPVPLTIVGSRNGLPQSAGSLVSARPLFARPQYVPDETVTITHAAI